MSYFAPFDGRLLAMVALISRACGVGVKVGNTFRAVSTADCPAATPYCQNGRCEAELTNEACNQPPTPVTSFVCNGDGYFPDPGNCQRYFLCVGGSAYQYDCSSYSNTQYSHARAMCVPR